MIAILLATEAEAAPLVGILRARPLAQQPFSVYRFDAAGRRPAGVVCISGMGKTAAAAATSHLIDDRGATTVINVGICGALTNGKAVGQMFRIGETCDGDAVLRQASRGESAPNPSEAWGCPAAETPPRVLGCGTGHGDTPTRTAELGAKGGLGPKHPQASTLESGADESGADEGGTVEGGASGPWADLPSATLASVDEPVFAGPRKAALATAADLVDMEGFAVARAAGERGVRCYLVKAVSDLAGETGKGEIQKNIHSVSASLAQAVAAALEHLPGGTESLLRRLMNFTKVEHTLFSVPLLLAGAYLGAGKRVPPLRLLGLIVLAGVGARVLGMAANRIFDRSLDALNKRTAGRELTTGRLSAAAAYAVAVAGLGLYLLACWALGPIPLALSPLPAIPLITYSLLKRYTCLCHFGIGLCLAIAPLAAFIAASGGVHLSTEVLLLGLFTLCWMAGFDIIYSLQDLASDREIGVHSMPARLGATGAQIVSACTHAVAIASLAWLWRLSGGRALAGAAMTISMGAFVLGYVQRIPVRVRFFPIGAVASVAGALVPLLGELP